MRISLDAHLLGFLLQKCFSFLGKSDYTMPNLTSLNQFALMLYLFLLTLDIGGWKVLHAFLVGLVNTENQSISIAGM